MCPVTVLLRWAEIALIWDYSIASVLVTDLVKVQVYRHLQYRTTRHEGFLARLQQSLHDFSQKNR